MRWQRTRAISSCPPNRVSSSPRLDHEATAPAERAFDLLPLSFTKLSDAKIIAAITAFALGIRIYLSIFAYCISGDGIKYVQMAQDIAGARYAHALQSVFPPLYPALIAMLHVLLPDWELCGDLISAVLGGLTVIPIYYVMREVMERRDLAVVAAAIVAVDPALVRYSASVRTEAGYICLLAIAVSFAVLALKRRSLVCAALAGLFTAITYFYRTEAVAYAAFVPVFIVIGAFLWHEWGFGFAIAAAIAFGASYLIVASPYIAVVSASSGHLAFSRELHAAMMYGMGDASSDPQKWRHLGYHDQVSLLTPLLTEPRVFLGKLLSDFVMSFYFLAEALTPVLAPLLALGVYRRGREILTRWPDAFLLLMAAFYFCGFSATYTGPRFMTHLIAFMFGWVALGIVELVALIAMIPAARRVSFGWIALVVLIILSAISIQNDSYDIRGIRYAGEEVARLSKAASIVSDDRRYAFYAGAESISFPEKQPADFCGWITTQRGEVYVALTDKEETHYGVARGAACLARVARYPRGDNRYIDLFKVRN